MITSRPLFFKHCTIELNTHTFQMQLAFWPSLGLEETQPFFAPALLVLRDDSGPPKHTAVLEPTPSCAKKTEM